MRSNTMSDSERNLLETEYFLPSNRYDCFRASNTGIEYILAYSKPCCKYCCRLNQDIEDVKRRTKHMYAVLKKLGCFVSHVCVFVDSVDAMDMLTFGFTVARGA